MKPGKLMKPDPGIAKAMTMFLSLFASLDDATAFQKAVHGIDNKHLPPCVRVVRDGGVPTALYWRWLAVQAEAWS